MARTARENFSRMMAGDGYDRLPLDISVTPPVADRIEQRTGTRQPTEAFDLDVAGVGAGASGDPTEWREALIEAGVVIPDHCDLDGLGHGHVRPPAESVGEAYHFAAQFHPLEQIDDLEQIRALPWPDVNDPTFYAHLPQRVRAIHDAGRVAVGGKECTVFEAAWYRRGMDVLFMDLAEGNPIGDWLLDWFTEHSIAACRAYVEAGVDVVGLGDDIGTQRGMMMAPDFWRAHLKPRLARVIDAIREAQGDRRVYVRYHSDGDVRDVIEDLIEIGVDILNPMQPECMPVAETIRTYQDRLAFWGMIGTQTTMPFGSTAEVRAAVRECGDLAGGGARLVIAPTHVLEPEVPWANIEALVEATRAWTPSASPL